MARFAVLGVPIDSAGVIGGTELAPAAFRRSGLVEALAAEDLGDLETSIRGDKRDPETGVLESSQVDEMTRTLRGAAVEILAPDRSLIVLGGCCAVVPGILAAARDAVGPVGIVHIDGHLDLYDGTSSPGGEAADMPLSVALGVGPPSWIAASGGPSLTPENTWILGYRDGDEARASGSPMPEDFEPPVSAVTTEELRRIGLGAVASTALDALARTTRGIWIHLDLDVVDPTLFFANDAPIPEGIDWAELTDLLRPLLVAPTNLGISICCYNPEKDMADANLTEITQVLIRSVS